MALTLTSGGAIAAVGPIASPQVNATSVGGLSLSALTSTMGSVVANNTGGNVLINNASNATFNVSNTGGDVTIGNAGDVTYDVSNTGGAVTLSNAAGDMVVASLSNTTGPTMVTSGGNMTLTGDVTTTGAGTTSFITSPAGSISQNSNITADSDVLVQGGSIAMSSTTTTTSGQGDITYLAQGDIVINDLIARFGAVFVESQTGDLLAAVDASNALVNGSEIESSDITLSGEGLIGEAARTIGVKIGADNNTTFRLESPSGLPNAIAPQFTDNADAFDPIGVRSPNAQNRSDVLDNIAVAQGVGATQQAVSNEAAEYNGDVEIVVRVGRGVAIPCAQASEDEACK